jgi:hypothetical protein
MRKYQICGMVLACAIFYSCEIYLTLGVLTKYHDPTAANRSPLFLERKRRSMA